MTDLMPRKLKQKISRRQLLADFLDKPFWYNSAAPLGSAVRYVAALSPSFKWVGVYVLKGKWLKLGPYLGEPTQHTRIQVGQGVCGTAVAEQKDQNVPDVSARGNYLSCSLNVKSELVVLVRDKSGKLRGQIDIDSDVPNAFLPDMVRVVRQTADELGALWPA